MHLDRSKTDFEQILLQFWFISNKTEWSPVLSVIILLIKKSDSLAWLQTELGSTQSYYHYKYLSV